MAATIPPATAWNNQLRGSSDGVSDRQKKTTAPTSPAKS